MPYHHTTNDVKRKCKSHYSSACQFDPDASHCPLLEKPGKEKVQYLYVDPVFIREPTPNSRQRAGRTKDVKGEEIFVDCVDSIEDMHEHKKHNILDVIDNIQDAREFKSLLREMANTSQILYRCFRRAYHTAKKTASIRQGVGKKHKVCDKCLRKFGENPGKTSAKVKANEQPCEPVAICDSQNRSLDDMPECNGFKGDNKVGKDLSDIDEREYKQINCLENRQELEETTLKENSNINEKTEDVEPVANLNELMLPEVFSNSTIEKDFMNLGDEYDRHKIIEKISAHSNETSNHMLPQKTLSYETSDSVQSSPKSNEISKDILPQETLSTQRSDNVENIPKPNETSNDISPQKPEASHNVLNFDSDLLIKCPEKTTYTPQMAPLADENDETQTADPRRVRSEELHHKNFGVNIADCIRCPCLAYKQKTPKETPEATVPHTTCSRQESKPEKYVPTKQSTRPICDTVDAIASNSGRCLCSVHHTKGVESAESNRPTDSDTVIYGSNKISMTPLSFVLPINLQIQTRKGETHYIHTQIEMEATVEQCKPKHKSKNCEWKRIRSAATAQTQVDNMPETSESEPEEAFFSLPASPSSSTDDFLSKSIRPCATLIEMFEIIKQGVSKTQDIDCRMLGDIAALDVKACAVQSTPCSQATQTIPSTSSQPPPSTTPPTHIPDKIQASTSQQPPISPSHMPDDVQLSALMQPSPQKIKFDTFDDYDRQGYSVVSEGGTSLPMYPNESLALLIEESLKQSDDDSDLAVMYYTGDGFHEVQTSTLPQSEPPPNPLEEVIDNVRQKAKTFEPIDTIDTIDTIKEIAETPSPPPNSPTDPAQRSRVSAVVQTDILSASAYAHLKRNDLRKDIVAFFEELVKPENELRKYKPEEKEKILKDLRNLFKPNRDFDKSTSDASRESVLDDINVVLHRRNSIRSSSNPMLSSTRHSSKITLGKSKSTDAVIKDIRHVLNPKGHDKPSRRYTTDNRDQMLHDLRSLLTPASQREAEVRDSVLQDLRLQLAPHKKDADVQAAGRISPKPLLQTRLSDEIRHSKIKSPSGKKPLQVHLQSSSEEEVRAIEKLGSPSTSRQAPPVPKKPNSQSDR